MITTPTVLVLGAGASMDFGYPSGRRLKQEILSLGSKYYEEIASSLGLSGQDFWSALSTSGKTSVDAFLEHRRDLIDIGKFAIARILIAYENHDYLFRFDYENWYDYLFQQMNCEFTDFPKNNITFITFNYDRTLEYYLSNTLKSSYGKKDEEVAEILNQISIIHVHGKLGNLPWQAPDGRPYLPSTDPNYINNAAKGIQIISEISDVEINFGPVVTPLREAKRIIFLGFGYNSLNLSRLFFKFNPVESQLSGLYGTCVGLTGLDERNVSRYIQEITHAAITLSGSNPFDFLRSFITLSD